MRHNILIVDDEQPIRQGLRARIEYLGIDVDEIFEAENGLMALRLQEEHPIDVVITDIRMEDGQYDQVFFWVELPLLPCSFSV